MTPHFSPFYLHWISQNSRVDESHLDCSQCRMTAVGDHRLKFLAELKCCTYFPFLPNFTLGALLESTDQEVRVRLKLAFQYGFLTPLGLFPTQDWLKRADAVLPEGFGRSRDLLCPFFNSVSRGCSIWRHRPGVCSSYFCHSQTEPNALPGKSRYWKKIESEINVFEWTLAHEVLWRIGFTKSETEQISNAERTGHSENGSAPGIWFEWDDGEGRREELLVQCYRKALEVKPAEIEFLLGSS